VCSHVCSYFEMEQAEYVKRGVNLSVEGWLVKLMVRKDEREVEGGPGGGGGCGPRVWHWWGDSGAWREHHGANPLLHGTSLRTLCLHQCKMDWTSARSWQAMSHSLVINMWHCGTTSPSQSSVGCRCCCHRLHLLLPPVLAVTDWSH
jgi:hypothetical protein